MPNPKKIVHRMQNSENIFLACRRNGNIWHPDAKKCLKKVIPWPADTYGVQMNTHRLCYGCVLNDFRYVSISRSRRIHYRPMRIYCRSMRMHCQPMRIGLSMNTYRPSADTYPLTVGYVFVSHGCRCIGHFLAFRRLVLV